MSLRQLMNPVEKVGREVLTEAVSGRGSLFTKVKLSDVVNMSEIDLDRTTFDYGTRAHLDYVVVDVDESTPLFAVELDGKQHRSEPATRRRDRMKDSICERAGLPLLRVERPSLTPGPRRRRLLEYLVDAWFYARDFERAQEDDLVPWDEPCMYTSILELSSGGGIDFVNDLGAPGRAKLMHANLRGLVTGMASGVVGERHDGFVEAHSWVKMRHDGLVLWSSAQLKSFNFYAGIGPSELASDLADAELGSLADRALDGEAVAIRETDLDQVIAKFRSSIMDRVPSGHSYVTDPAAYGIV